MAESWVVLSSTLSQDQKDQFMSQFQQGVLSQADLPAYERAVFEATVFYIEGAALGAMQAPTTADDDDDPTASILKQYSTDDVVWVNNHLLDRIGALENSVYGALQQGTLTSRLGQLELDMGVEVQEMKAIDDRVEWLELGLQRKLRTNKPNYARPSVPLAMKGVAGVSAEELDALVSAVTKYGSRQLEEEAFTPSCSLQVAVEQGTSLPLLGMTLRDIVVEIGATSSSSTECTLDLWSGSLQGVLDAGPVSLMGGLSVVDNEMSDIQFRLEYASDPRALKLDVNLRYEFQEEKFSGDGTLTIYVSDSSGELVLGVGMVYQKTANGAVWHVFAKADTVPGAFSPLPGIVLKSLSLDMTIFENGGESVFKGHIGGRTAFVFGAQETASHPNVARPCLEHCQQSGPCIWCGDGNRCCRLN
jgi:hypothetical protein